VPEHGTGRRPGVAVLGSAIALAVTLGATQGLAASGAVVAGPEHRSSAALVLEPEVEWTPSSPVQGTLFRVVVRGAPAGDEPATGSFAGEALHFRATAAGEHVALAAVPVDASGDLDLEVRHGAAGTTRRFRVPVAEGSYRMERLSVPPRFGAEQPPEIRRRIADEAARARAVSAASHSTPRMWELPFVAPRESVVTSGFGHGRVFNGQVQSRHMGVDYRGAVGAPVRAPARGVVALVDTFFLGGGVIYIDHGAGLVTGYLHLSAQEVREGDVVEAGQVIGSVGATGRVTGPHLHWIVRYGGITVDGLTLLALSE
jgi:murein DD-endopeptidase MepM/ murein hydrolase activator NlpD